MTLDSALEHLWTRVHGLRDAVVAMQLTVVEDRPRDSDVVPVEALGDAVGDLLAAVQETLEATSDGLHAIQAGDGHGAVRGALLRAHRAANHAGRRLADDVADRARLGDLDDLTRRRGFAWRPWMAGVVDAVDRCRPPLWAVQESLLGCWSELTDRLAEPSATRATDTTRQL
jgi:hypothetical protein